MKTRDRNWIDRDSVDMLREIALRLAEMFGMRRHPAVAVIRFPPRFLR